MNPDLADSTANRRHRLPVVWIESLLYTPQLEASKPPHESRKCPQSRSRAPEPD
jgi:hypothetical protein